MLTVAVSRTSELTGCVTSSARGSSVSEGLGERGRDDEGTVDAPCSLGVVRVDRAALERADRVLDEAGLVERVRVDVDLDVEPVADVERGIDGGGRRAPVLQVHKRQALAASQHARSTAGCCRSAQRERDADAPRAA